MSAREVLFPRLFPTPPLAGEIDQQVAKLSPGSVTGLLAAIYNSPAFANAAPLVRRNDPATSKAAAAALTASGGRESAKAKVLAVFSSPSYLPTCQRLIPCKGLALTSAEIADEYAIAHPTVHKRLPDLRRDGLVENGPVRKCTVTGRPSLTWKVK